MSLLKRCVLLFVVIAVIGAYALLSQTPFAGSLPFTAENTANKNLPNGYAGLDANGLISVSELPLLTIGPQGPPGPPGPASDTAKSLVGADGTTVLALTGAPGPIPVGGCALSTTDGMWHCKDASGVEGAPVKASTPASSSALCTPPQIGYDNKYAYFCTAPNVWKQVPLSSF